MGASGETDWRARALDAERHLAKIEQMAHIGHWVLDVATSRLSWSAEIFSMFEIDPTQFEATYAGFLERVHPEDRAAVDSAYQAHLARNTPYDLKHRLRFPDGRIKHVHERCETDRAPDGTPLRSLGTVQDITAHVSITAEVQAGRDILQQIIDTIPVRVFWKDPEGRYLGCNRPFAADAAAECPEDLLGRSDHELVWRENAEAYRADDALVASTRVPKLAYEEPQKTPRGDIMWVRTSKVPLQVAPGQWGVLGVYEDVTAQREAAQRLREATATAERAARAKSEFLANMTHEIRTPMNAVVGFADLALQEDLPEPALTYTRNIQASATDLLAIINDILDFSKIESGRLQLEARPFSLSDVLHHAASVARTLGREKDVVISVREDPRLPAWLLGDETRLTQVAMNLVSNAIKFTSVGTVVIESQSLPASPGRARARVLVSDTGIGMTPEQAHRIFEPFTQADASVTRRFGGTGLGLSITRRLVEAMGGLIEVDTAPGRGSRFGVVLEFAVTDPAPPDPTQEAPARAWLGAFEGQRALLVDDNAINRSLGRALLRNLGFTVEEAEDGQRALDAVDAASVPYDVVFMDVQMPGLDGLSATRRLRTRFSAQQLPIIAMTANAFEQDRLDCLQAGMNEHVPKPLRLASLGQKVTQVFEALRPAAP